MGEFDFLENMKDEEELLFKRCIRKLLDATFIIEDRDERLYQYLSVESNCYDVSAFLRKIGYDVVVEDKLKVAMLVQNEADLDTVGIKRSNLVVFDGKQVQMLLALWLLYLEKGGFSEEIYVTVGDVIDKCKVYGIEPAPTEFRAAFKLFKRFSLLAWDENDTKEDSKVKLYPSLQFCMDIPQLKQVMREYLPEGRFDPAETEAGEEGEDAEDADDAERDAEDFQEAFD